MARKVCIYTVNIGDYDVLRQPLRRVPGADYYLVTDNPDEQLPGYKTIAVDLSSFSIPPVKVQRMAKILPFDVFPEKYDLYIYYDASYQIIGNLGDLISRFKGGLGLLSHPSRDCIYQEGEQIVKLGKATRQAVNEQLEAYAQLGIPPRYGLQQTGILIRDASEQTKALCAAWWSEVRKYTHRDQLGLPAAIFKTGIQPTYIRRWMLGGAFKQHKHKEKPVISDNKPRVAYIQPFTKSLNIGEEYNYHCSKVDPKDWICVLDQDFMFPYPKTKAQIEDIVTGAGKGFDLIGCMTNRIASPHQCYNGIRSEDPDIRNHYEIAKTLHEKHYGGIKEIRQGIAGFFMLMPAMTWQKFEFAENDIRFDTTLSQQILKAKGRIGLLTGVYGFHYYRFNSPNPQYDYAHLTK